MAERVRDIRRAGKLNRFGIPPGWRNQPQWYQAAV